VRQPRVAELVASDLRKQILEGEITQDSALPRQEELQAQFGVSLPSIREALRILEGEGLITVRRGNRGGAVVHLPTMRSFVYMQSLLLQSRRTTLSDVALALQRFEPTCAAMCAERTDLTTSLVPVLEALLLEQREVIDADLREFNRVARRFHSAVVEHCGNDTIRLTVGGWVSLWSSHEESWSNLTGGRSRVSFEKRRLVCDSHERIAQAIFDGDSERARRLMANHLEAAQQHHFSVDIRTEVDATLLLGSSTLPTS
jgi:GntR family transcriptional repressor for pyruvate dehydrogenase complex